MLKKILILGATALALAAMAGAPASAQYPEPEVVCVAFIADTTVTPGQTVGVSGESSAETVTFELEGELLATIPVEADGTFSGSLTIPSDLPAGNYVLVATCDTEVLSVEITVGPPGPGGPGGPDRPGGQGPSTGQTPGGQGPSTGSQGPGGTGGFLANTGSPTDTLLKIAGGLLLAGAAALLFATKRRRATA